MKIHLPAHLHQPGYLMCVVTGGRFFSEEFPLFDALDQVDALCARAKIQMTILQGGAPGADKLARTWAWHNNVRCITERAKWEVYGKAAGPLRNQAMIDKYQPDICLAFPSSPLGRGTADMVERCAAAKILIFAYDRADE